MKRTTTTGTAHQLESDIENMRVGQPLAITEKDTYFMRITIALGLVSFAFALIPAPARADGIPRLKVDAGIKARFNVYMYDPQTEAARLHPWYTYFPYEAHFQSPSPYGTQNGFFPNLPGRMVPGAWGAQQRQAGSESDSKTQGRSNNSSTSGYTPSQYAGYPYGQVPSYWYGR